jgi:hypothetical protein
VELNSVIRFSAALLDEAEDIAKAERAKKASAASERIKLAKATKASSGMDETLSEETPTTKRNDRDAFTRSDRDLIGSTR